MATFDKEIKSNRLLQSKRYTVQNIDGQEAYTNVLDLNSSEIYTQQNLLPTSSLPYSSSAQDGSYITSGSSNIAQYYWRTRLTPTNATVDSSGNSGGNLAQAWVPISGSDYNPISLQSIASGQIVNWISNKYIRPDLNTLQADVLASGDTPGYNVVLLKNTVSDDADNAEIVPGTEYQFDYKTGVIQFTSPSNAPNRIHYLYLSGYVYLGKTLAEETFGSTFNTSSFLITASAANNIIEFTKGDGNTFTVTVDTGSAGNPFPFTGSALITGSLGVTGSINATSITSSFQGDLDGKATKAGFANFAGKLVEKATGSGGLLLIGNLTASNMSASGHISASQFSGIPGTINELTSSFAISASYAVSGDITPGGSDTEIQFNSGGSILGGSPRLTFDSATGKTTVSGSLIVSGSNSSDIFLIKSESIDIAKVDQNGNFILVERTGATPTAVEGGIMYSSSAFYVGVG